MREKKSMRKIMEGELYKIRYYKKWTFHGFAYPNEIDEVRRRLGMSGIRYRTEKVFEGDKLLGYKVYVL